MCRTYSDWSAVRSPYLALVDCSDTRGEPVADIRKPVLASHVFVVVNRDDPVVPAAFQRQWRSVVGASRVLEYGRNSHDLGNRDGLHP
jgi:hypothetical protein